MRSSPLDQCWYAVATVDAIGDGPLAIEVRNTSYVIWRTADQRLIAVRDRCSHRESPLLLGTLAAIPSSAHLSPLPVAEHYGLVWFCPGDPSSPVPHLDVEHDGNFTRLNTGMQVWNCSATRMIDNMLDVAHFPFVHAGTFGREQEQLVPHFGLEQLDDTFYGYEYTVVVDNEGEAKAMSGGGDDVIGLEMTTGFALPFSVRSTMSYDNGIEQTLFMTATPIDAERSYFTFVLWRNDDVSTTGRQIVDFELEVAKEDRAMLEKLSGALSLERGALVDVASDKASLEWRRRYRLLVDPDAG